MSLCCRRVHQNNQQATAPATSTNSLWYAAGVQAVCVVSGGVIGGATSIVALMAISETTLPFKNIPLFSISPNQYWDPTIRISEFIVTYGVIPGTVAGHFVANRILK